MHQKLQREYGLAGAWSALQQRRPALRQAAIGDFVESLIISGGSLCIYTRLK